MKPEIENLKAWIYGKSTTGYQRALGMREFEQLLSYVNELEQLRQPLVSGQSEQLFCECQRHNPYTGIKFDFALRCFDCNKIIQQNNCR